MIITNCERASAVEHWSEEWIMQIVLKNFRRQEKGYGVLLTMVFLAIALIACASVMYWASTNAEQTFQNNQYNMSGAAAEGAVEKVLSQMDRDFLAQSVSNNPNAYYALLIPQTNSWPIQYTFSDTNGNTGQISVNLGPSATNSTALNSQYTGLYGLGQNCTITAMATPIGQTFNVPATVIEQVQFAS